VVDDDQQVIAYYTLVAAEVDHSAATAQVRRGLSKHFPIPVCLLARLAVDRRHDGLGLGSALLSDALARAAGAAEQVGMRAVIVDAFDERAAAFYRRFGLEPVTDDGLTLMVTVAHVREVMGLRSGANPVNVRSADVVELPDDGSSRLRADWGVAFALLGGYGYRPKLTVDALIAYRADSSTVTIGGEDGGLPAWRYDDPLVLTLEDGSGAALHTETVAFEGDPELVELVLKLLGTSVQASAQDGFIRHFPPSTELGRLELIAAYAAYRPELDALADHGIHAYIEETGFGMRIYSDVASTLLLDISIADDGVPILGPDDGPWVVFLTAPDGHEAEFTVDRSGDRHTDAWELAEAVTEALTRVLRGGHVFLEHYDSRLGRLDSPWFSEGAGDT
jgi:predicted N-acetyltransferase YhbS